MRIGLIADIHGNSLALDAVLAALDSAGVEQLICLGDVAVFGPDPRGALARLRVLGCPVVMGNTDAWALDPQPHAHRDDETPIINAIELWGAAQLNTADRDFIRTFVPTWSVELANGARLLCCHGSPRSFHEGIFATTPIGDLEVMLAGTDATVIACAHTHAPLLRRHGPRLLVNPGSVGQPIEFDAASGAVHYPPWAEFAILESVGADLGVTHRRIPISVPAPLRQADQHAMPQRAWYGARWGDAAHTGVTTGGAAPLCHCAPSDRPATTPERPGRSSPPP